LAITYDTVAPTGTVTIAGTLIGTQLATRNPVLALTLSFTDTGGSGPAQKAFAVNGGTFSTPAAYSTSSTVTLAGADGLYSVATRVTDLAGNAVVVTRTVLLDRIGPTVTLSSPLAGSTVDVGQTITFTYSPTDVTGIASSNATLDGHAITNGSSLNIDTLAPGTHTIVVVATDGVGNTRTTTFTFQVRVTSPAALGKAVSDGNARGLIDDQTAKPLLNKLADIQREIAAGLFAQARSDLAGFESLVSAQRGRKIDAAYADLLLAWAADLRAHIP
jgi:hypothetical protein